MYMSPRSMGASFYSNVGLQSSIHNASPHRLIQMLMEGVIERINVAKIAMERGDHALKGVQISKAIAILGGLKDGLDFEKGGELAANLNDLYSYMEMRLFEASAHNDVERLEEVKRLMLEVKGAWDAIPEAVAAP